MFGLYDDETDYTTLIIVVGPRDSSTTWECPTLDYCQEIKWPETPDECGPPEIVREDGPRFDVPPNGASGRVTRGQKPRQQESTYG